MFSPLLKLISKVTSLDRLKKDHIYLAKKKNDYIEYIDENGKTSTIKIDKVTRYFYLCDCGTWSGQHDAWCMINRIE
jgi:hypothetical protein